VKWPSMRRPVGVRIGLSLRPQLLGGAGGGSMHYERTPRFRRLKLRVGLAALQTQDG
jgi:hypothetical protein